MEIFTKKRPTGLTEEDGLSLSLPQLVERELTNGIKRLLQVVDPRLAPQVSKEQEIVEELLKLALSCTCTDPEDRPNMHEVLSSLLKLSKRLPHENCILRDQGTAKKCAGSSSMRTLDDPNSSRSHRGSNERS